MAKEAGVVKSLTGKAVAVDQNGNARELKCYFKWRRSNKT